MYCSKCGKQIVDGARFCTHCGASANAPSSGNRDNGRGAKLAWGSGQIIGLTCLAFICPLAGWIIGGLNLKYPARKSQAMQLILTGVGGFIVHVISVSF